MGMSLSTVSGVGLLLPLENGEYGLEDPSELLEERLADYKHLSYSVARFVDWVGGAAIFADSSSATTKGIAPIVHKYDPIEYITNEEMDELLAVSGELEIPFHPEYITLVSYW